MHTDLSHGSYTISLRFPHRPSWFAEIGEMLIVLPVVAIRYGFDVGWAWHLRMRGHN